MLEGCIASQSEVIRAIVSEYSPCCGVPNLRRMIRPAEQREDRRRAEHAAWPTDRRC